VAGDDPGILANAARHAARRSRLINHHGRDTPEVVSTYVDSRPWEALQSPDYN
jgi:hypothetical protein